MQFSDFPTSEEAVFKFEQVFDNALESLLSDLAAMPWYIRERQVINLLVFEHLVPKFHEAKLDIGQIGIEVPVWVKPETAKNKHGVYADLVIWPHNKATCWYACKPLAWIEWKHCSCRDRTCTRAKKDHDADIVKLERNPQASLLRYGLLTKRHKQRVEFICKKINGSVAEDFPPGKSYRKDGTGDERPYKGKIADIWKRAQSREICDTCKSAIQPYLNS